MIGLSLRVGVGVAVLSVGLTGSAFAERGDRGSEHRAKIELLDDCDPASFNAAIGPGTCVGDGTTTFGALLAEFRQTGAVALWRMQPSTLTISAGTRLEAENEGGETHSFTKVKEFGGGFVDALNARPNGQRLTERPECGVVQATGATLLRADDAPGPLPNELELTAGTRQLPVGTNLFQCCIHPWMHAVVTVKP